MKNEKIKTTATVSVDDVLDRIPTGSLLAKLNSRGIRLEEIRGHDGKLYGYRCGSTEGDPDALAANREDLRGPDYTAEEEQIKSAYGNGLLSAAEYVNAMASLVILRRGGVPE